MKDDEFLRRARDDSQGLIAELEERRRLLKWSSWFFSVYFALLALAGLWERERSASAMFVLVGLQATGSLVATLWYDGRIKSLKLREADRLPIQPGNDQGGKTSRD